MKPQDVRHSPRQARTGQMLSGGADAPPSNARPTREQIAERYAQGGDRVTELMAKRRQDKAKAARQSAGQQQQPGKSDLSCVLSL
jgi:hypothetical protein